MNPEKASLVSHFACHGSPEEIVADFRRMREQMKNAPYHGKEVLDYHIIQSFAPNEVTAEEAHRLGLALCERLLDGKYQYVIATHTDKDHIHNHIIVNKTNMENLKSLRTCLDSKQNPLWRQVRRISDELCKEHGLSVLTHTELGGGVSHYEWEQNKKGTSWKARLRYELDCIIMRSDSWEDFLDKCKLNNIEVVYAPDKVISLKFRMQGQERFIRSRTLGYYYDPDIIRKRIQRFSDYRQTLYVDRSKHESEGYQHWADIQNMKNVAQMINMLESYNIHSTKEIKATSMSVMARRGMLSQSIATLDKRIDSLSEQIELVRRFRKVKPIHEEYKSLPERRKAAFIKKNAPLLDEYREVGKALKELFPKGKFPTEESLNEERQALYTEREGLYGEYQQLKKESADLDRASHTIEDFLDSLRDEPSHKRGNGQLT